MRRILEWPFVHSANYATILAWIVVVKSAEASVASHPISALVVSAIVGGVIAVIFEMIEDCIKGGSGGDGDD